MQQNAQNSKFSETVQESSDATKQTIQTQTTFKTNQSPRALQRSPSRQRSNGSSAKKKRKEAMEMRFQNFMTKDINHWLKKETIERLRIEQAE
jgi:hypothetical protein